MVQQAPTLDEIKDILLGALHWSQSELYLARPATIWRAIRGYHEDQQRRQGFIYTVAGRVVTDLINVQVAENDRRDNYWTPWQELQAPAELSDDDKQAAEDHFKQFAIKASQILNDK